jgi:acetyl-CoA carboxylase biotin carboxyl carrier protein
MNKPRGNRKKERSQPPVPNRVPQVSARGVALNGLTSGERKNILDLVELLKQHNLAELELEREGFRVRLRRDSGLSPVPAVVRESAPAGQALAAEMPGVPVSSHPSGMVTVTSPIVGTFYRSPSPDADPYVEEGDRVKKGQVLCVVEAMKLMNEIESEMDGRIVKILAESTKPVEYGQALFLIDPSPAS